MPNVTYLSGWQPELCLQLNTENNHRADFNRLQVRGLPKTEWLQQGGQFENAGRDSFVLQLKSQFDEALAEGVSHVTLYSVYTQASLYLRWCDAQNARAFTQNSLQGYMSHLQHSVMVGELKRVTYGKKRSSMVTLFTRYLELPLNYFDSVVVMDASDAESFEAYTRRDLNQLLPFLRQLFKQTYTQFIEDPKRHINAHKRTPTMTFKWQGERYLLCSGISKMMCAATYLMAYYTYANTSDLLQLKQPKNAAMSTGEMWYTMPAFKRRAFKTIQVEMGPHKLDIPKYALSFFDMLLNASTKLNSGESAPLLQTLASKTVQPVTGTTLQSFLKLWVEKHFTFTDATGRRLRPVVSRFRETGSQLTAYHQGDIVNNIMLNNTSNTRKRHYSKGSELANIGMMQDTMSIREEQVRHGVGTQQARQNLDIDVLVIEAESRINLPNLSRTPNGGSCAAPFGEKSQKYTRRAQTRGLTKDGERLACADLLACFGCPDQVIVQSVSDIWCLLSFKACIEESLYLHLDASHYRKNFEEVVRFIERKILPKLHKPLLRQAEVKLTDDGHHPAWDTSGAMLGLLPASTEGVNQ